MDGVEFLAIVFFMVLVAERVIEQSKPLVMWIIDAVQKFLTKYLGTPPGWVFVLYTWLVVGVFVAITQVNVFGNYIRLPVFGVSAQVIGQVVTVIVGAGGSNLLHDLWPDQQPPRMGA